MRIALLAVILTLADGAAGAVGWKNLDAAHHLGGRKASAGYLQGKVVLVCRWSPEESASKEKLQRLEEIWQGFKTKSFVVLGGLCEDGGRTDDAKGLVSRSQVTFPTYAGAALEVGEPAFKESPFLYVVDETGKVVYRGRDDREATQAVVMALTDMESPRNLAQWRRFLDYEMETLPGRAYLRANEFRKKFPEEAKGYYAKFKELTSIPNVRKLAELVDFSRKAKDMQAFDAKSAAKKQKFVKSIDGAIAKYGPLAEAEDPRVAQEAKNALADLKWAKAAL